MTSIAVIIPSRRRPESLKAVLRVLQATASGEHDITYAVSFERDDLATEAAAFSVPGVRALQRPLDCTPGAAINNAIDRIPQADIYTGLCDDIFPLTWHWDILMDKALRKPIIAWCWEEAADPMNASYICVSGRVRRAIGALCPEYFPYWFNDLWFAEIHHMAFGFRPPLLGGLKLGGQRGKTHGLRDFIFWCQVFTATRPERIALAVKLAAEYGSAPPELQKTLQICHFFDQDFRGKSERFERRFGDDDPAAPYYVLAKQRAETMLTMAEAAE